MSDQFDLEQQIMDCWSIIDDLKTASEMDPIDEDKMMNILIGLSDLYQLKFEKLFNMYENFIAINRKVEGVWVVKPEYASSTTTIPFDSDVQRTFTS